MAQRKQAERKFKKEKRLNQLATPGVFEFIVILDHLKPGYNVGKIFRSADVLGAHEVHLIGLDYFNPYPAMGSFKWVPARFFEAFEPCCQDLHGRRYDLFALSPDKGESIFNCTLPRRSAFIFGHEEFGLSFDPSRHSGVRFLSIPGFGRTQSLNVSNAAAMVMFEYVRQHIDTKTESKNRKQKYGTTDY